MTMKTILALSLGVTLSVPVFAQETHSHDDHEHKHAHEHEAIDFGSIDDGWAALEDVSAEIRAAVETNNMNVLHNLSDRLHAIADGLKSHAGDVPEANQLRFTSSLNQLRTLSDRFHEVHDSNDTAGARRLVPQLNGMVQLLMVSAEGK